MLLQSTPAPLELDFLVNTLRNPGPQITVQDVLSYLYNYVPYVRHEHNLRIVISSFLNNPVCFGPTLPPYETNYLIIEVFKLIADKKLKVSQPSLPINTFYSVILKELQSFVAYNPLRNSWKVLPIISGLLLANELRDSVYPSFVENKWYFKSVDSELHNLFVACFQRTVSNVTPPNIIDLALISLALKARRGEALSIYLGPISSSLLVSRLIGMMFGAQGGVNVYKVFGDLSPTDNNLREVIGHKVTQNPAVKHLGKLSFLLDSLFSDMPYDDKHHKLILDSLSLLLEFNTHLSDFTRSHPRLNLSTENLTNDSVYEQQYWFLMKNILFSQVIIYQGILTRFLSQTKVGLFRQFITPASHTSLLERKYIDICYLVLHNLYQTNHILLAIGQGGFDGYNFVYYVSLEILLKNNKQRRFEHFSRSLVGNYSGLNLHSSALARDYIARCKLLFVIGLWENYLQQSPHKDPASMDFFYSISFDLVKDPNTHDMQLIEAGHSLLLAFFLEKDDTPKSLHAVLEYFELLVEQFPARLSAHQLSFAVETLGKKILSKPVVYEHGYHKNSAEEFLEFVAFKCSSITPGQSIKQKSRMTITSAQPVLEIEASSTMSQLKKEKKSTDIVKENKHKKPKDFTFIDVISTSSGDSTEHFTERTIPDTSREGILHAFLNVIPYLPMSIFVHWLERTWMLIMSSNMEEQKFLIGQMWRVLSENLDLNRCEIAYEWWYETKRAVERNTGQQPSLFKL